MSWNLLTGPFGLKPTSLYITYFGGDKNLSLEPDVETREIWREIGVQDSHIIPFGIRDNFWEMASTGPCGTSTEIHYDLFPDRSNAGDRVNKGFPDLIELWNIVFIEFHRMDTDQLIKLPIRHVDTGMGFERLVAVLQGKLSNYDTDLFQPIISAITKKTGVPLYGGRFTEASSSIGAELDWGYRILADHTRMFTVALTDGMFPDQNHRLRRVLRKAMLVSKDIFGCDCELLTELTYHVAESLSDIFPEVGNRLKQIHCIIAHEEELYRFLRHDALSKWLKIVERRPQLESLDIVDIPGLVAGFQQLEKILPPLTNDNASGTSLGNNSIRHLSHIPVHHLNDDSTVFQINNIMKLENMVQQVIKNSAPVKIYNLTSTQLLQTQNVTLVPGEVYPEDNIKLVEVFSNILTSREPCCGTHVCNTSDLVKFSVVNLHSIGAGTRSLQAVTGSAADQAMNKGVVANKRLEELSLIVRKHLAEDIENKEKANDINKHISNFELDLKNRENLLPYIVRVRCLEDLTCLKKQLKEGIRGSLRDSLKTEMFEVMDSFSKNNEEFIVHFLSCSSHMATVPLQKATNICSNVPVLLIAISEGLVKARCCVPKHNVSEHFNAKSWMHTILSIFQASGGPPRGQNPHITYNMKGKKIPDSEIKELIEKSLKSATDFAVKHFKQ
uniref:alanine--tRNA ligase n=1 Tax=Timema monikensis TaxID=170555 RepID=A0A7R9HII7_9NEOP|nr:unnamed protein product [Timema monikensis]